VLLTKYVLFDGIGRAETGQAWAADIAATDCSEKQQTGAKQGALHAIVISF
jgi:hypothetical protein